jgi:hypothetical protein
MSETNEARIALLKSLQAENPSDPFPNYALAIEYRSLGDNQKAIYLLRESLINNADYLPAYYPLISLLIEKEELTEALQIAHDGIVLATQQKNLKTASEIRSLIELEIDEE